MTQGTQSIKVLSGEHEGRAGRVLSAYPYDDAQGVSVVDVILDADMAHGHLEVTLPVDQVETLG